MRLDTTLKTPPALPLQRQRLANSLRLQVLGIFMTSVVAPLIVSALVMRGVTTNLVGARISVSVSLLASLIALLIVRRVTSFPGTHHFAYIIPAFGLAYGIGTGILLALRLDYSTVMLLTSFFVTTAFAFVTAAYGRGANLRFQVLPFGSALDLVDIKDAEWIPMSSPHLQSGSEDLPLVADLRFEMAPEWERMLASAAISGRAVYHSKQLRESLTGKVEIEHLSENSFGSLIPNMAYRKLKRAIDFAAAAIALPLLVLPFVIVAAAIKLDSPGPVFFRQRRMGHRGYEFEVVKFRTMKVRSDSDGEDNREVAITEAGDQRITRLGRFMRRNRIDELPQLWNVFVGEMSLIGPRPEALPLSQWYERELPFYRYRLIVRPGITGWAQVNQGHVADLESVHEKLHYDFYYIKNFSAWLDILITLKTIHTVLTGFGSK